MRLPPTTGDLPGHQETAPSRKRQHLHIMLQLISSRTVELALLRIVGLCNSVDVGLQSVSFCTAPDAMQRLLRELPKHVPIVVNSVIFTVGISWMLVYPSDLMKAVGFSGIPGK